MLLPYGLEKVWVPWRLKSRVNMGSPWKLIRAAIVTAPGGNLAAGASG